jgi:hypothetical protein
MEFQIKEESRPVQRNHHWSDDRLFPQSDPAGSLV